MLEKLKIAINRSASELKSFNIREQYKKGDEFVLRKINDISCILKTNEIFNMFNYRLRVIDDIGTEFDYDDVSIWIIESAQATSTTNAINELMKYVNSSKFPVYKVILLNGIMIEKSCEIIKNVWLVDIREFPSVRIRNKFKNASKESIFSFEPSAALIEIVFHPKIHTDFGWEIVKDHDIFDYDLINDLKLCISYSNEKPNGVQEMGRSLIIPDYIPHNESLIYKTSNFKNIFCPEVIDILKLKEIRKNYTKFSNLNNSNKNKLRFLFKKLNEYSITFDFVEKAILIRVILENLCIDRNCRGGIGSKIANVIAEKFSVNEEERTTILKDMKRLYSICSSAVHNGYLDKNQITEFNKLSSQGLGYVLEMMELKLNDVEIN